MRREAMPCLKKNRTLQKITIDGAIAQLGERLPCTQEVSGSIPLSSTIIQQCLLKHILKMTCESCLRYCSLTIRNKLKI